MTDIVLKTVTEDDCKDLWLWRNHPEARKNFFNSEPVSWRGHKRWFTSKIKDPNTKIYVATIHKDKVGVIRFEIKGKCVRVSINLNPKFFGRGLGAEIIRIGTEKFYCETKLKKSMVAEIKIDNIASQKAFMKAGYGLIKLNRDILVYRRSSGQLRLIGKKIYLRPLEKKDINKRYLSWLNDAEVTRYMETGFSRTKIKDLKDFYKKINTSKNDIMFAIVAKKNGSHIGNIKLGSINWHHRYADLGIMIGEKAYWGKGCGQEVCSLLLDYAFRRLGLNKVILGVYSNHTAAIEAYKNIGFDIEGRIKKLLNFEGNYVDKIIMGICKNEFLRNEKD